MNLFIYGAGGHAKVIAESAVKLSNVSNIFFVDDNTQNQDFIKKYSNFSLISKSEIPRNAADAYAIVGIGDNQIRSDIASKCTQIPFISILSSSSIISNSANILIGSYIGAGAIINADSCVSNHVIINTQAVIEHDCDIGSFSHIGPGSILAGGVKVGNNCFIGGGAFVNPNLSIANDVVIGSGSLVVDDIHESGTYIGSPIRKIK